MKSDKINPWAISPRDFPLSGSLEDQICFVLGYAILAPSSHNAQPWLFFPKDNICRIRVDSSLQLPESDKDGRYAHLGVGCCIEFLKIAAEYFGILERVEDGRSGRFEAIFYFKPSNGDFEKSKEVLLRAMIRRVNVRGPFKKYKLEDVLINKFKLLGDFENVTVNILTNEEEIKKAGELTARGLRRAHSNRAFRRELSRWINHNWSNKQKGIPAYTMNVPTPLSFFLSKAIDLFDLTAVLGKLNYLSIASASAVFVITSKDSSPVAWAQAGRAMARIMLQGVVLDMFPSVYVAATEFTDISGELKEVLGTDETPLIVFCMGKVKKTCQHAHRESVVQKIR